MLASELQKGNEKLLCNVKHTNKESGKFMLTMLFQCYHNVEEDPNNL